MVSINLTNEFNLFAVDAFLIVLLLLLLKNVQVVHELQFFVAIINTKLLQAVVLFLHKKLINASS